MTFFVAKIELFYNGEPESTLFHKGSGDRQRLRADLLDACIKLSPLGWEAFGGDDTNRTLTNGNWTHKASLGPLDLI